MKYKVTTVTSIADFIERNKPYVPPQTGGMANVPKTFTFLDKNSIEDISKEIEVFIFEITPEMGQAIHTKRVYDFFKENGWRAGTYSELLGLAEQYPEVWNKYFSLSAIGTLFEHIDGTSILTVGNHPLDGKYIMLNQIDVGWFPSSKKTKRGFICVNTKIATE